MFFQDLSTRRGFPRSTAEIIHSYAATTVISQELWTWREPNWKLDSDPKTLRIFREYLNPTP